MAVFLINVCKYNGCGITFPSLSDLISHIEDTHIDYDPKVVEQKEQAQPACLPLSYVLRFITEENRKEAGSFLASNTTAPPTTNSGSNAAGHGNGNVELKRKLAIKHHSYSMSSSNRSTTPTGSEMDEDEMVVTESEDSNDSWTTEEFSSEFIMRYGSRHSGGGNNGTPGNEKPFACPVPGCKKRYKNVNGIKYHSKNGHKKDGRVRKGYKCHCGKSYKTAQGLKNHALHTHNSQPDSVLNAQLANALAIGDGASAATPVGSSNTSSNPNPPPIIQRSNSPSQSLGSLSPSSISNMSSSASSCHGGSGSLSNGNNGNNGSTTSNTAILTSNGNVLQQLSAGNVVTLTNLPTQQHQQQQPQPQQQQQQQQLHQNTATGNSNNNNLMRSTLGLVSIKTNNTPTAKSVSNLMAANATASKILKLATNVANGGSSMDIVQQQQQHNKTTTTGQTVLNGSKPLPNLVNLGILTPATSPTKNTQTLTFTTTNGSTQQQQALVASLAKKTNILLLQEPNQLVQQVQQQQQQQQLQQQVQQQHHVLPISPTSSVSGNSSKSSSPTPQQQQQQLLKKGKLELIEPMETDEGQSDGISESVAAAIASITDCKEDIGGATVAGIEVVGAGAVNEET
ncbi:myb-like protein AA isoform X1 [Drosophila sechellia]|uniref:Myb-like protein AA isoform X1 n=1 Tax=Drosophila mauritiana TaxID=7226 RepID=A0A6P8JZY0_DROMA|nr:myb-like protein AA isoform X1 [Drosophila sechellia]XP_033162597.1 myb-like protein AA isoform X1 [Drosophila mauritiana]